MCIPLFARGIAKTPAKPCKHQHREAAATFLTKINDTSAKLGPALPSSNSHAMGTFPVSGLFPPILTPHGYGSKTLCFMAKC
ncbi:hypothetical protein TNIN_329841 [Trichonephila inaurata madagascariensis]|uniref:Uncharacterized protein n=1 Tax=Trichonephila inaurata madagascariensis TaxID=2747483 RepID=A0A8X7C1L2_9ARAC|nr:hypothetical protein TNIN_329841 [Trichonephila inaurata madagascariensis]